MIYFGARTPRVDGSAVSFVGGVRWLLWLIEGWSGDDDVLGGGVSRFNSLW